MTKETTPTRPDAPSYVVAEGMPDAIAASIRIVDAKTGEPIVRVIEADAKAGALRRFDVADGNLIREGDSFKVVEEKRAIRIEWAEPPVEQAPVEVAPADATPQGDDAHA